MLRATKFRVQNFRNIDDSGWIPLEKVTAFVGRNESGKTTLLKALHKFNPATEEPYNAQREFPRDRYTRDFKRAADWPVCSVAFQLDDAILQQIIPNVETGPAPETVIATRYYDGSIRFDFEPAVNVEIVSPEPVVKALKTLASAARRLTPAKPEDETQVGELRTRITTWVAEWVDKLAEESDLRNAAGVERLSQVRKESEKLTGPLTADSVETFQDSLDGVQQSASRPLGREKIVAVVQSELPVFIYFEDYGILDSAIYLPRFVEDLKRSPDEPRVRTVNAMFRHVGLSADEILALGRESSQQARSQNQQPTETMIREDQRKKEARAIKLNSASLDITRRFNEWYGQRRHTIDYQADGDYFRIWIADDRRPGVKIELEGRSKGFQWFFSFYLIFLVESEEGHKDAILLLDEPGLHLHPTAQQELIAFLEKLSETNQLAYTTHSPFLIDGEHLHRVRPVTEDASGHSHVSVGSWPADRETIFPLQAAAGYAMVRGLFQHKRNVLVEGMTDYYYLHALSGQCRKTGRTALPDDVYVVPCGGTKMVGQIAALFLGQDVRPIVLLDGDDAGRVRRDALTKDLYSEYGSAILMLDEAIGRTGQDIEIEDILGEDVLVKAMKKLVGKTFALTEADRKVGSLPDQIKAALDRLNIKLPEGWKASAAIQMVSEWAESGATLPDKVLEPAASLFQAISGRFGV
jgi:predicted ATPase